MKKSLELLKNTGLAIKQVASKAGYKDYFYFNKVFKKQFDLTPTEYRNKIREGAGISPDRFNI